MYRNDFLLKYDEYIESLVGNNLTDLAIMNWIKSDCNEFECVLTDQEIDWIIQEVRRREGFYV